MILHPIFCFKIGSVAPLCPDFCQPGLIKSRDKILCDSRKPSYGRCFCIFFRSLRSINVFLFVVEPLIVSLSGICVNIAPQDSEGF